MDRDAAFAASSEEPMIRVLLFEAVLDIAEGIFRSHEIDMASACEDRAKMEQSRISTEIFFMSILLSEKNCMALPDCSW